MSRWLRATTYLLSLACAFQVGVFYGRRQGRQEAMERLEAVLRNMETQTETVLAAWHTRRWLYKLNWPDGEVAMPLGNPHGPPNRTGVYFPKGIARDVPTPPPKP